MPIQSASSKNSSSIPEARKAGKIEIANSKIGRLRVAKGVS
jgi:hypothetical protein